MATRTITGNLAADPEIVAAGSIQIVKFRVIENTGEYRRGEFVPHETPTTHFVEARFELGQNIVDSVHKGDQVIVVGREHTESWVQQGSAQYRRVIEAETVGPALNRATAVVHREVPPPHKRND